MVLAFVDANVLAAPVPRTILYLARLYPEHGFSLTFSPFVEDEATKHQLPGHIKVPELRERLGWNTSPDPADVGTFGLVDTNEKDGPVLAAAASSGAKFLITGNVRHFGRSDLSRLGVSAVHPGLFLAYRLTSTTYAAILRDVASRRGREPKDPLAIHEREISVELPQVFERFPDLFGPAAPDTSHKPPAEVFRGTACVRCARPLRDRESLRIGAGPECRAS